MADLNQLYGDDLQISATGDLLLVDGDAMTQQAVLRRLLTNQGDDVWNPNYGAGLGRFVGEPMATGRIAAIIRAQLLLETGVAQDQQPMAQVIGASDGSVLATVTYADAVSRQTQTLAVPVTGG